MATVRLSAPASVDQVFAVLSDPTTYPEWLVGARRIRAVDPGWPAPGTRFHHRVGLGGPFTVADSTEVLEISPPRLLRLRARARPLGRAEVTFRLDEPGPGTTRVEMEEHAIGAMAVLRPVLDPLTRFRNRRSLAALADRCGAMERRLPD